ncbi:MAG: dihydrofolate reductase [Alphaproteobacteria bacterium]|nr:dihydrofolate reductase [Alphaproteobacteria bacterium]MDX5369516.1 dihydrofolate reductase [Alphaproteobacteria bacterium]MDX5464174.1 dihydrofolate reductase [Alphaproteobacteria bacterium]
MAHAAQPVVTLVVAVAENGVIGAEGGLPWHLPEDLKHFRAMTMGKPMVMGRRTFESIGKPLPGRTSLVVSATRTDWPEGVECFATLEDALDRARDIALRDGAAEIAVIGGGALYRAALPLAGRIHLTRVGLSPDGDTHFPPLDPAEWTVTDRREVPASGGQPAMVFETLERTRLAENAASDRRG